MNHLQNIPCAWQTVAERETKRGRVKAVLIGIPGPLFWHRWRKTPGFKAEFKAANATLAKEGEAWAVVVWVNRHNRPAVEGLGFTVPEVAAVEAGPF